MLCRPAISSHSLGRAWMHNLDSKLNAAAAYGLDIEMFYEDLEYLAKSYPGGLKESNLLFAAREIRSMCNERGIAIVCLQPFMHYGGLRDRSRHRARVQEFEFWIQLAQTLGTNIISVPSSCLPKEEVSSDPELLVSDLREVADSAAHSGVQVAYESLAWGTHVNLWEHAWEVVRRVDRPNFGICLDTFNIAARVFADPEAADRRNVGGNEAMRASIDRMVAEIDVEKIQYVQVVDGTYLSQPLTAGHKYYDSEQPARMSWSRNCRLFYGEDDRGAYLPVKPILKAILVDLGYTGWVSGELFNESLTMSGPDVPEQHAQRMAISWERMSRDLQLEVVPCRQTRQNHVSSYSELPPRAQL